MRSEAFRKKQIEKRLIEQLDRAIKEYWLSSNPGKISRGPGVESPTEDQAAAREKFNRALDQYSEFMLRGIEPRAKDRKKRVMKAGE